MSEKLLQDSQVAIKTASCYNDCCASLIAVAFPLILTSTAVVKICSTATCTTMNFHDFVFPSLKLSHGNRQRQLAMPMKCCPMWDLPWQKKCHHNVFDVCGLYSQLTLLLIISERFISLLCIA